MLVPIGWITLFVLSPVHDLNGLVKRQTHSRTFRRDKNYNRSSSGDRLHHKTGIVRAKRVKQRILFGSSFRAEDQNNAEDEANTDWLTRRFQLPATWNTRPTAQRLNAHRRITLCDRIELYKRHFSWTEKQMNTILRKYPVLLSLSPENNVFPTVALLKKRLELSDKDVSRIIKRSPSILGGGIMDDQSLQRNIDWLAERLQIKDPKRLGRVLVNAPTLLTLSVETNMAPTLDAMQEHLSLDRNETALVFRRAPQLMTSSFAHSIRPKIDWLQHRFSLDEDELRKLVKLHPPLVSCNIQETLEPKLVWLTDRLGGISEESLTSLVIRAPTCLSLTTNRLGSKLDFLQSQVGPELTTETIEKCPIILGCSLKARLKPRLLEARQNGLQLDGNCLQRIALYTNDKWAKSVAFQVRRNEGVDGTELSADW